MAMGGAHVSSRSRVGSVVAVAASGSLHRSSRALRYSMARLRCLAYCVLVRSDDSMKASRKQRVVCYDCRRSREGYRLVLLTNGRCAPICKDCHDARELDQFLADFQAADHAAWNAVIVGNK